MEIIKARVESVDAAYFIEIAVGSDSIRIPMSEDKPIEVKSAFNKLIARIKVGEFQIELEKVGDDLFSQVAKEYVTQLNSEISEVFGEMQQKGLVQRDSA
ncbi:hypothetical protein [Roseimaritima ulvae]|uniref:Uncharacterized protein n=1 Tax=Roseimaritima ulvae TaxID=980254 RepID=A0A5B9R244_9BACT|nr:hypothetical protein [Roseimaritima ulvae]QEG40413.1 hypothetical protein UC8_24250 [Roseimaritima ulvae]